MLTESSPAGLTAVEPSVSLRAITTTCTPLAYRHMKGERLMLAYRPSDGALFTAAIRGDRALVLFTTSASPTEACDRASNWQGSDLLPASLTAA